MRSAFNRSLAFIAALVGFGSVTAVAADVQATARYAVTLGGTHVATVEFTLADGGGQYQMSANARITGLAQFVASGTASGTSAGRSTARGLTSEKFSLATRTQGEEFSVAITYGGAAVTAFSVNPPVINTINRVPIERKQLAGVNDMFASFVLKGPALDRTLCNRNVQVFTGIERFNLSLRYAKDDTATSKRTGYQGPVVVCNLRYTPISGHYTSSELTTYLASNDHMLIWYAPLATPGIYIPYRILVTTTAGDLSLVLTQLDQ